MNKIGTIHNMNSLVPTRPLPRLMSHTAKSNVTPITTSAIRLIMRDDLCLRCRVILLRSNLTSMRGKLAARSQINPKKYSFFINLILPEEHIQLLNRSSKFFASKSLPLGPYISDDSLHHLPALLQHKDLHIDYSRKCDPSQSNKKQ